MLPEFKITVDGLWLGDTLLNGPLSLEDLSRLIPGSPRVVPANTLAPEWRDVWIFDEHGIYILANKNPRKVVCIDFIWQPNRVPYPPNEVFKGTLSVGNVRLHGAMRKQDLPESGLITLSKVVGNYFSVDLGLFFLSVRFARVTDTRGRKGSVPRLAYAELGFSEIDMPSKVISERVQRN